MRALSAQDVIGVWEQGRHQHAVDRALTMLGAAVSDCPRRELAAFSIGARDALLLSIYERTFGGRFTGTARCPGCAGELEFSIDAASIRVSDRPSADLFETSVGDLTLRFRLPCSLDLAAVASYQEMDRARAELARRCVISATQGGEPLTLHELEAGVIAVLAERMSDADPQADVMVGLCCPACEHPFEMPFDIVSFCWEQVNAHARQLLVEVHLLARAYGWREADILAMSPDRRESYLQMVDT